MISKEDIKTLCEPFNVVIIQLMQIIGNLNDGKRSRDIRVHPDDLKRAEFYLSQTQNYRTFLIEDLTSNINVYTMDGCEKSLRRDRIYFESYISELNHLL